MYGGGRSDRSVHLKHELERKMKKQENKKSRIRRSTPRRCFHPQYKKRALSQQSPAHHPSLVTHTPRSTTHQSPTHARSSLEAEHVVGFEALRLAVIPRGYLCEYYQTGARQSVHRTSQEDSQEHAPWSRTLSSERAALVCGPTSLLSSL